MITAPLFTIGKAWKQPQANQQGLKRGGVRMHMYTQSTINRSRKKNETLPLEATEMDLKNITLSEVRQRKTYYLTSLTCNLKNNPKLYIQESQA